MTLQQTNKTPAIEAQQKDVRTFFFSLQVGSCAYTVGAPLQNRNGQPTATQSSPYKMLHFMGSCI